MPVYRYKFNGPSIAYEISKEVPGGPTLSNSSNYFVDVNAPAGSKTDLDDAMLQRGWSYVSQDPTDSPVQAEGATVTALTFAAVNAAIALANAAINVNSQKISNLLDPTSPQDAATKAYVDAVKQGLDPKDSVRVVATSNIALTGTQTIDGVAVVAGDRVLCVGQTTGSQNGIYVVAAGAWARAADADVSAEVTAGMYCWVTEGTANADSGWVLTTNDPIVLGTTALSFTQFTGAGQIIAGAGLTKSGNTINVIANGDGSIVVNADDIQVGVLASDAQHGNRGGGALHALAVANGAAGFLSGADKAKLDGLPTSFASDSFMFGAGNLGTSSTTRYLTPGYDPSVAPTTARQFRVPRNGTIKNLRVHVNTPGTGATNITYTLRKNGVATALATTMANSASDGSDVADTVTVAAGDLIDIQVSKAAGTPTPSQDILASVEFAG